MQMASVDHRQAEDQMPRHEPAMVAEILEVLDPAPGETALDLTVGTGGHSLALAGQLGEDGLLVGIDADASALAVARARLEEEAPCAFHLVQAPFSHAPRVLQNLEIDGVDVVLADLGVGTHQLLSEKRGFGFESDAPLDMRYDTGGGPTAAQVVNELPEKDLADIFYHLGEERYSRQIASRICRERAEQPIETAAQLADLIKNVVARRSRRSQTWRIHPATRSMMALRIYVNREMEELDALLEDLPGMLNRGARVGVLTYHSLEARRVKLAWREQKREGRMELIRRKPVMPSDEEVQRNPSVRSVQLRTARRPEGGAR
jgi:16S rRNA (cytosine1402-N4)-methyltransferase